MKKAELSINIIIVAAIALLVLVIIAALLIRQYNNINNVTNEKKCAGGLGTCLPSGATQCSEGTKMPDPTCDTGYCCVKTEK